MLMAVALAAIASAAAYAGLHSAQQKANRNAALTSVFVLKGAVPRDDSAGVAYALGLIKATKVPMQLVPAGAVSDLSAIRDDVALYDLPAGEVVVKAMFETPGSVYSVAAARVPKGEVAVSVSTDAVKGVAGLVGPGDKVDILVDNAESAETFLYQSVTVLAVDTTLAAPRDKTVAYVSPLNQAKTVITFAVPGTAATQIAKANNGEGGITGGIYLALEPPGRSLPSTSTITVANLVPGNPTGASITAAPSVGGHVLKSVSNPNVP